MVFGILVAVSVGMIAFGLYKFFNVPSRQSSFVTKFGTSVYVGEGIDLTKDTVERAQTHFILNTVRIGFPAQACREVFSKMVMNVDTRKSVIKGVEYNGFAYVHERRCFIRWFGDFRVSAGYHEWMHQLLQDTAGSGDPEHTGPEWELVTQMKRSSKV